MSPRYGNSCYHGTVAHVTTVVHVSVSLSRLVLALAVVSTVSRLGEEVSAQRAAAATLLRVQSRSVDIHLLRFGVLSVHAYIHMCPPCSSPPSSLAGLCSALLLQVFFHTAAAVFAPCVHGMPLYCFFTRRVFFGAVVNSAQHLHGGAKRIQLRNSNSYNS